jgi:myo-inositol-1(or 4)-monophosphatase
MAKIFCSYARQDRDKVAAVKEALERHNHEVWLDEQDITVGLSIPHAIQIGLNTCDFLAVFLTKAAAQSHWVKRELATFLMRDTQEKVSAILPLKFEECRISDFSGLIDLRYADFTTDFDKGIHEVLRRIDSEPGRRSSISKSDYERLLFAIDLAVRAGTTTMMYYNRALMENASLDERKNTATEADKVAQIRTISQIMGHHEYERETILAEEEPYDHVPIAQQGYTWVLDPLDGTINFINRIPMFCSAVSVLKDAWPFIGVVFDPVQGEIYYAIDGQQTQVWKLASGDTSLVSVDQRVNEASRALLGTHISSRSKVAAELFKNDFLLTLANEFRHVRAFGCGQLALAYVATGRLHAFVQLGSYLWDQTAGVVLVRNAGGVVRQMGDTLKEWTYQTRDVVACANESILAAVERHLPRVYSSAPKAVKRAKAAVAGQTSRPRRRQSHGTRRRRR